MVREPHQKIAKDAGPYAANGTMRALRAVWNTARKEDEGLPESPTAAVAWFQEKRRQNAIPLAQLPQWFCEVEALRARGRGAAQRADYYLLAILTGLRRESLSSIRREDIDPATATLWVPKPKGGKLRAFRLPLSDAAVAVVDRRLRSHNSEWVFPADSKSGHVAEPRPELSDGFTVPFTVHGLRSTYISAAHAAGISDQHAKLLANHAVPKSDVHGGYVLADVDALRPSQQRVTDYLRQHGLPL